METVSLTSYRLPIPPVTAEFGVTPTFITTPVPNGAGGSLPSTPTPGSPSQTGTLTYLIENLRNIITINPLLDDLFLCGGHF